MINTNMSMGELGSLRQNYDNGTESVETSAAVIARTQLEDFLNLLPSGWDAIKINLIRYPLTANQGHIKKITSGNLSQVSVILTPGKLMNLVDWNATDLENPPGNSGFIHSLSVCKPAAATADPQPAGDNSSLCPPKPSCKV